MNVWDHPENGNRYETFCEQHARYREANRYLVENAGLAPGMCVLDLGAGTGRTAETALPFLGVAGRVLCVEPAAGMRHIGESRVKDHRVQWASELPSAPCSFARILCGAVIWQLNPLAEVLPRLRGLVQPGGALCFTIPALYLQEPDVPGSGTDPLLLSLPTLLADGRSIQPDADEVPQWQFTEAELADALKQAGFRPQPYRFQIPLTQEAYADWHRIPAISMRLMPELSARERDRRVDAALKQTDAKSWKWERWYGCNAWKPVTDYDSNA